MKTSVFLISCLKCACDIINNTQLKEIRCNLEKKGSMFIYLWTNSANIFPRWWKKPQNYERMKNDFKR